MNRIRNLIAGLGLALLIAACVDGTAPLTDGPSFAARGRWATESTSSTTTSTSDGSTTESVAVTELEPATGTSDVPENAVRHSPHAPPLETYHARFRATQGKKTQYYIHYQLPWGGGPLFLKLIIPPQAQLVDETGRPLNRGESVDITIDIDPVTYLISFGPHGSTFDPDHPARLVLAMEYADWSEHSEADAQSLGLHYQPAAGEPWAVTANPVSFDPASFWASVPLDHFSNYAIAW